MNVTSHRFWRVMGRLPISDRMYYRLLDLLTDNNGWRPLNMRYPQDMS